MKTRSVMTLSAASLILSLGLAHAQTDLADAEVRRIDKAGAKITLKHGEIKNLDMPPMTMVFQVKDPAVLDTVKPGDQIKFKAEKVGRNYVVTEIQAPK
jgi:Cu(I)/Ag(I) efflux system periplasmic protein CusF